MGADDEPPKTDKHLNIYEYQEQYFEDHAYNLSQVVRQALDDRIVQDGADPDRLADEGDGGRP